MVFVGNVQKSLIASHLKGVDLSFEFCWQGPAITGLGRIWDLIVSVPDHCLSFYFLYLWIDCLFEIRKIAVFPLAFIARWLQGHWWGFISRNYVVWPIFLLMNVFIALKGSHFWFLFDFTAAGVVPCGGRKTSPRTSTIVQFIFYFGPLRSAIIFWEIRK